jgi:carboxymethylenebutenolidase
VQQDVAAGVGHLCKPSARRSSPSASLRRPQLAPAAASGHGLRARSGSTGIRRRATACRVRARAAEFEAPILALQAGDDANIGLESNAAFEAALSAAGAEHELVVYEGAPHSFFDRKQEQFADASEDAWRRVLEFIGQHR